ncbi:hypothetical protein C2E23DRAFT_342536 [Lenzites betulinus]|nr:hypothetical protein C2E23DRAFT_342536 [Lenzites betulinus]
MDVHNRIADAVRYSDSRINIECLQDPSLAPVPPPTIPLQQQSSSSSRDSTPHLSSSRSGNLIHAEMRKPQQSSQGMGDNPTTRDIPDLSSTGFPSASITRSPKFSTNINPMKRVEPLASASDLLLSDIHRPGLAITAQPSRNNMPPRKRRRLSPIVPVPVSAPTSLFPPLPPAVAPSVPTAPTSVTTHLLRLFDPPPESQPPAQAPAVKPERSPSPVLHDVIPLAVTEGCVRIAPLPPECKNTRPGYRAARKAWTAREARKLRERGVRPTRIFVRDDGMVIDWMSDVLVMPDTLRPPPSAKALEALAKQQQVHTASNHAGFNTVNNQPALPVGAASSTLSPIQSSGPSTEHRQQERIPAPGHTIWKRVLPPPRPTTTAMLSTQPPTPSPFHRSPCPSPALGYVPIPPSTVEFIDLTEDGQPDVEIIDLTDEPSGQIDEQPDTSTTRPRTVVHPAVPLPPTYVAPFGPTTGSRTTAGLDHSASVSGPGADTEEVLSHDIPWPDVSVDEKQEAALQFLKRYLTEFSLDRAALASAYSRVATFSSQTLHPLESSNDVQFTMPSTHHCGRLDIIAALLDVPGDDAFTAHPTVDWDFVYGKEAGDVLLICYATAGAPPAAESAKGKGKGKAVEGRSPQCEYVACEQRFILRPRDWDEEDRCTPGLWPLVAVCHQMLFRRLPP